MHQDASSSPPALRQLRGQGWQARAVQWRLLGRARRAT